MINKAQEEQLKALRDITVTSKSKVAFTAALGSSFGPFEQETHHWNIKNQESSPTLAAATTNTTGIFTTMALWMYYLSYTMYNNNLKSPTQRCNWWWTARGWRLPGALWATIAMTVQPTQQRCSCSLEDSVIVKLYNALYSVVNCIT